MSRVELAAAAAVEQREAEQMAARYWAHVRQRCVEAAQTLRDMARDRPEPQVAGFRRAASLEALAVAVPGFAALWQVQVPDGFVAHLGSLWRVSCPCGHTHDLVERVVVFCECSPERARWYLRTDRDVRVKTWIREP